MSGGLEPRWWQRGVIYQIYPWSFMDSNGDGIGDLPGIRSRLDYLVWLGVDAIWISPIYPSPMADFGYDVSDYRDVDPRFGTLADFDALLAEAHRLGLKVILDYVPNHTSDQHPWFRAARSARDSSRRDFYIWRDAAPGGGPPTNWLSEFGGSAWQWDELTGQYYYHAYLKEQPDLNFRNPEVQAALLDVLRFWLDRGVDGFRIDTIHHLIKDQQFRDNPPNPHYVAGMPAHRSVLRTFTTDRPEVQEAIAIMRRVTDEYPDRVLIGEAWLPIDRMMKYYGVDLSGLHLPFNFQLIQARWDAAGLAAIVRDYEAALPAGAWPNWVLGNHDRSRIATRVGQDQARVAALLLLTLRGTPTLYYGDEIGMPDVPVPLDRVRDPWGKNVPGFGLGRDPERTPMQWTRAAGAGFTTGTPWLPLAEDYLARNVEVERADPQSILSLTRAVLALRRREPALSIGSIVSLDAGPGILAFRREHQARAFTVVLNLTPHAQPVTLPDASAAAALVLSTHPDRGPRDQPAGSRSGVTLPGVTLLPNEGAVFEG
jgi:alpha-glucosidase